MEEELRSYHACTHIEEVAMSIIIKKEYLCHYKFIDVATFDFVGDSIIEA